MMYIVQTTNTSRTIKQTFQALIKSKAILAGYKIPYVKSYFPTDQGRMQTQNIQLLYIVPGPQWDKSGHSILSAILKTWSPFGGDNHLIE